MFAAGIKMGVEAGVFECEDPESTAALIDHAIQGTLEHAMLYRGTESHRPRPHRRRRAVDDPKDALPRDLARAAAPAPACAWVAPMHRPMITVSPASSAILRASSLEIPSWSHRTFAPASTAARATSGVSSDGAEHVHDVRGRVELGQARSWPRLAE